MSTREDDNKKRRLYWKRALTGVGTNLRLDTGTDFLPLVWKASSSSSGNVSTRASKTMKSMKSRPGGLFRFAARGKASQSKTKTKTKKKGYTVQMPTKMLRYICLIFLAIPGLLFFYSEMHVHDEPTAHYKADRTDVLDTKQIFDLVSTMGGLINITADASENGGTAGGSESDDSDSDGESQDSDSEGQHTEESESAENRNATSTTTAEAAAAPETVGKDEISVVSSGPNEFPNQTDTGKDTDGP
eukprot:CAMPEP_0198112320 /NCGR_PEP_ID=MMETSP1442-20131203/4183_1 /TAXON_ID= /ORGANISM="Craspedostauros australis, Strain CCMP3328" /LENGTH=244 /DNA_ID=CAMNT_0043769047 /DNA_START=158 /DNA_END=895 /DNA_ORIENTATION=+